jgi:uncharacterized protein Yka (UPF0111/DUF47 family)
MFSLQKVLGKEEEIFRLLEASATEARNSVQALVRVSQTLDENLVVSEFARLRQIDKKITEQISGAAYTLFVTVLDREDIEELSVALYKIPKMVDKFAEKLLVCPKEVRKVDFSVQIGLLERSADVVVEMVRALRKEDLKEIQTLDVKLHSLEAEADHKMVELYRQLFNNHRPALEVIALKDLYEQLEKAIDRCGNAGSVITHIGLKNS